MIKGSCLPISGMIPRGQYEVDRGRSCRSWRDKAMAEIRRNPPDLLVITASKSYRTQRPNGTGIAPFVSMCRSGNCGATILHGVRTDRECYYADLLREKAASYVPCLSAAKREGENFFPGRVTRFLRNRLPAGVYDFYLCGRREMIAEAIGIIDERFDGSRIYTEIFY